ncbi:hypothetical protein [Sphingomonas sp. VNH70]|uniref:hypothetical protein n=1 Tax=Sphingomonas silueang TaxID=3156617 RepID=UPI0032B36AE0
MATITTTTVTTLAELKAAATSKVSIVYVGVLWTWTAGDYTGKADDVNVVKSDAQSLTAGAWVRQTSHSISYQEPVAETKPRTLFAKQLDRNLSPFEFMSHAQQNDVRSRAATVDVTAALQECFNQATNGGRTVELPDGHYLTGNLSFGSQSTSGGQSSSPAGLIGSTRSGSTLIAKPGTTGTLLKSWSLAGITFRDFNIITENTPVQAWDCEWKISTGPSTQNIIENIIISGGTAPLHVNFINLNDTYPTNVTVRTKDISASSCGIDATQSGGLNILRNCILSDCYLRFGAQNGVIDSCWTTGIEFAQGCLNYIEILAGYIYANPTRGAALWSQSYDPQQSVRALKIDASQFISVDANVPAYFDINAYSTISINETQFLGLVGRQTNLLGANSRRDSFANVLVSIHGGSHEGALLLNDKLGFSYTDAIGFLNDNTGQRVSKSHTYAVIPTVSGIPIFSIAGEAHRQGNQVKVDIRMSWNGQTASGPLIVSLPNVNLGPDAAVTIGYNGNSFSGIVPTAVLGAGAPTIAFYNIANGAPLNAGQNGDLILSVTYRIAA